MTTSAAACPCSDAPLAAVPVAADTELTQTVKHCGMFRGHTDGPHLLHSTSSIRTASMRGRNITPQVGTDACFIPPDRAVKRQTAHNRKVLDLSLQQSLLRGCSLHCTSSHLSLFRRKRMWEKKTQPTDYLPAFLTLHSFSVTMFTLGLRLFFILLQNKIKKRPIIVTETA